MLPDWSSDSMMATLGRARVLAWIATSHSSSVASQRTRTEPCATSPSLVPV